MNRFRSRTSQGFTLIEVMLAVVLLALLTGAAALSFVRPIRSARAQQTIQMIQRADTMAREEAIRFGRSTQLRFDLNRQTLVRAGSVTPIPGVREIRIGDRSISDDQVSIDVSPIGLSSSYAVQIAGPAQDQWIVVAGLSGETITTKNESQVVQLLSQSSRHDTR
jgi:prepilin-type N-terminal cleavage/methylation domain-containing protein